MSPSPPSPGEPPTDDLYLPSGPAHVPQTAPVPPPDAHGETASLEGPEEERGQSRPGSVVAKRYEIETLLGQGGMGTVYRVFDRELQRQVALKMMRPVREREGRDKREARFFHEARAMARLDHPGCVQIHDFAVTEEGIAFIVMELVVGETLLEVIRRGIAPGRAALLLHQVAGALQRVHDAGIVHRDVKPHNILVTASGAKLTDFGVAHDEAGFTRLTEAGSGAVGTPAYMPPEQTGGTGVVDARSDVYSLGATLYECLVNRPPFFLGHGGELLRAIRITRPVPPRKLVPSVPRDLEAIALRCLEKSPDERYATAREVEEELSRFLSGEPVRGRPPGFLERLRRVFISSR